MAINDRSYYCRYRAQYRTASDVDNAAVKPTPIVVLFEHLKESGEAPYPSSTVSSCACAFKICANTDIVRLPDDSSATRDK